MSEAVETAERAEIAAELRDRTDLTMEEIGEVVDRSSSWVSQKVLEGVNGR